jgi:hypothetical protein
MSKLPILPAIITLPLLKLKILTPSTLPLRQLTSKSPAWLNNLTIMALKNHLPTKKLAVLIIRKKPLSLKDKKKKPKTTVTSPSQIFLH